MRVEETFEIAAGKRRKHAILGGACLRGAWCVVEERELAEDDARSDLGDLAGLGFALAADQHAAGDYGIDRLTLFAFVEDDLALQEAALVQHPVDDAQLGAR